MKIKAIKKIIRLESVVVSARDDEFRNLISEKIAFLKRKHDISDVDIFSFKGERMKIESSLGYREKRLEQVQRFVVYCKLKIQRFLKNTFVQKILLTILLSSIFYFSLIYIVNFFINLIMLLFKYWNNSELELKLSDFLLVSPIGIIGIPGVIGVILFTIIVFLVVFKIIIPLARWKKSAAIKKNLKGSSQWEEIEQHEKLFEKIDINHPELAQIAGVPVDFINGYFYCIKEFLNSVILGSTRSGKSQGYVLPMIHLLSGVQQKENLIITDPKGELNEATHTMLEERGYDILVVDLIKPSRGNHWQMIHAIQDLYYEHTEQSIERAISGIKNISFILYQQEGEKDPLWKNAAKEMFNSSLLYFLEDCYNYFTVGQKKQLNIAMHHSNTEYEQLKSKYREENKHRFTMSAYTAFMHEVKKINPKMKRMKYDLLIDERGAEEQVVRLYATTYSAEGKTKSSILTTFFAELEVFQEPSIQKFMSKNEVDYKRFLQDKPVALFLKIPDYIKTRHKIATIAIEQMYQQLVEDMALNLIDKLPRKLNFLLDEIGNMPALDDLDNRLNVCLGRNIRYHLFLQDYDQLEKIYGEVMKRLIISACGIKTYIQTTSLESNKYFSELLGDKTVKVLNHNGHLSNPILANVNEEVAERALMKPQELERLGKWEIVTKIQRINPILGKIMPAFTSDYLKEKYRPAEITEHREKSIEREQDKEVIVNEEEGAVDMVYDAEELKYLYQTHKITYEEYKNKLKKLIQ